ncbi:MAG: hypothetical protein LBQ34_06705 [Alphaproteobacteria bacterium]|nr:hypothetical protein [Alphaproteobacteria bacterium]
MAFTEKVGQIYTDLILNADKASLEKAENQINKSMNGMSKGILSIARTMKGTIATIVASIGVGWILDKAKEINSEFEELYNLASKAATLATSLNISPLEAWSLRGAEVLGNYVGKLENAIGRFSRAFNNWQLNPMGNKEQNIAYQKLGITADMSSFEAYKKMVDSLNYTYQQHGEDAIPEIMKVLQLSGIRVNPQDLQFYTQTGSNALKQSYKDARNSGLTNNKLQQTATAETVVEYQKIREEQERIVKAPVNNLLETRLNTMADEQNKKILRMNENIVAAASKTTGAIGDLGDAILNLIGGNLEETGNKIVSAGERFETVKNFFDYLVSNDRRMRSGNPITPREEAQWSKNVREYVERKIIGE